MSLRERREARVKAIKQMHPYSMDFYKDFDYTILSNIRSLAKSGRGSNGTYNDIIIFADTETSKKENYSDNCRDNHIVAWTITLRAFNFNIVTLWGRKPSEFINTLCMIRDNLSGHDIYIYWHNLSYDWVFIRKYMIKTFGNPISQLNTKPHYPINIVFENGIIFKDSLILAQRSLDKWSKDMNVEHQKAIGKWDYNKIRNQDENFTSDELQYIEHDTLAGAECIDATLNALHKRICSMPYTATGIPREEIRNRGKNNNGRATFKTQTPQNYYIQSILEEVYHGGYTHANRYLIGWKQYNVTCKDFASSYPFIICSEKMPMSPFESIEGIYKMEWILRQMDKFAFITRLIMINPRLKTDLHPMPIIQYSKCRKTINAITDNGRIIAANYIEILADENMLDLINKYYDMDGHICTDVYYSMKQHLPRWLTDYVFELFQEKTMLKGGDAVLYALAKAKLNSVYGCMVQKPCKDNINEDYVTGEYIKENSDPEELYLKWLGKHTNYLVYAWGCWVTSYAMRNLFTLGECVDYDNGGEWIYSDTDSIYSSKWNEYMLNQYNESCKQKLINNGYNSVWHNNREYWLGIAESDGEYSEYVALGAKRYCGRSKEDNELHITVAGVPKIGFKCLNDNIDNFRQGLIFSGEVTGKLQHTYITVDEPYIDEYGNETADSVDLTSCDYLLDEVQVIDWEEVFNKDILIQVYDDELYTTRANI